MSNRDADSPLLATSAGSLTLKNPFLLSSGPPTATGPMIRRAFAAGWGGAVIKTIRPDSMPITDLSPRLAAWKGEDGTLLGFQNIELLSKKTVSYWEDEIRGIRSEHPDHVLIASIMGSADPESWEALAESVQHAGSDAIELNLSCPHGMPEAGLGAAIGQNPAAIYEITKAVRSVADIPVYAKLTPNITDIRPAALAAADAGADGISAINTVSSLIGVDIESFDPIPAINGYSTHGGYSGPAVKPIGLYMVSEIARTIPLPIMGIGGISSWQDAVEYMLLGAAAVQVCSAVMWHGYGIVREMKESLADYLQRKGCSSPDELRGRSLQRLMAHQALDRSIRIQPAVTGSRCLLCGRCVIACRDGGYGALSMTPEGVAVDSNACDGCGLCIQVCPTETLVPTMHLS